MTKLLNIAMINAFIFFILSICSCTQYSKISGAYLKDNPSNFSSSLVLSVETIDNNNYEFRKYQAYNDTLIIYETESINDFIVKAKIPINNILKINKVSINKKATIGSVSIATLGVLGALVLFAYIFTHIFYVGGTT